MKKLLHLSVLLGMPLAGTLLAGCVAASPVAVAGPPRPCRVAYYRPVPRPARVVVVRPRAVVVPLAPRYYGPYARPYRGGIRY